MGNPLGPISKLRNHDLIYLVSLALLALFLALPTWALSSPTLSEKVQEPDWSPLSDLFRLSDSELSTYLSKLGVVVFDESGVLSRPAPEGLSVSCQHQEEPSPSSEMRVVACYVSSIEHGLNAFRGKALIFLSRGWSRWELLHEVGHHLFERERASVGRQIATHEILKRTEAGSRLRLLEQSLVEEIIIEKRLQTLFLSAHFVQGEMVPSENLLLSLDKSREYLSWASAHLERVLARLHLELLRLPRSQKKNQLLALWQEFKSFSY